MSLALGASLLLVLAGKINVHILENVLFGSVLTVNGHDLAVLAAVAVLVPCLALPLYNRIMLASFNPQLAAVRGVAVKSLDYLFVALVTLVTVAAVKVIGAILVGALLVIPAAAARLVSQSLKGFFWLAVLIATVSTLAGILLPIMFDLPIPSGAAIILVAGLAFGLAAIARGCLPHLKGTPDEPETPLPRPGPGLRRTRRPAPGPRRDVGRGPVRASHGTGQPAGHPRPRRTPAAGHRGQAATGRPGQPAGQPPGLVLRRARRRRLWPRPPGRPTR